MLLKPTPISSSYFHYEKGQFVAERSDLNDITLSRVYDDAADIGFSILNERTGKHVVFTNEKTHYADGDVSHWTYKCVTPGFEHLSALIFND